ncbi:hypothetical protein NHX12_005733, partial [Muraenolepis orangiensis]
RLPEHDTPPPPPHPTPPLTRPTPHPTPPLTHPHLTRAPLLALTTPALSCSATRRIARICTPDVTGLSGLGVGGLSGVGERVGPVTVRCSRNIPCPALSVPRLPHLAPACSPPHPSPPDSHYAHPPHPPHLSPRRWASHCCCRVPRAICCTLVNCNCDSFKPGKLKRRQCENCRHGWVAHALSKLKVHHMYQSSQVEIVHSNVVFDICSLMLYGTQAIPVRLKILLDRLFSVLNQPEVIHILNALDWTLQDYIRGYVLQDVAGKVLDRWAIMTFEEEIATLQQFLRFGETKSIVELMALQDKEGQAVLVPSTRTNSDIRTFIERSTPRAAIATSQSLSSSPTLKVEKLGGGGTNVHHFENFINSMAFMLPFQLLGSIPAPLLGSPPGLLGSQHQALHRQSILGGLEQQQQGQQGQRRDDQGPECSGGKESDLPLSQPLAEGSLVGSSSASFTSDLGRSGGDNQMDSLSCGGVTTKMEVDDFPTSDNYSDGSSTPCTPSMSCEMPQMSPESKLRFLDRNGGGGGLGLGGGSLKKGRVYCSACEKTFYDKGTLKIHYNAVHLKIKHKCTIDGCNMVFSSLRSRNRHSANPNPRLHMPMNRNNRDKDLRGGSMSGDEGSEGEKRSEYAASIPISSPECHKSVPSYVVSHVDTSSKLHGSSFPSMGQSGILFPNLKTVQPVLPFYRSLVTPAELAHTPGTLPSLPLLSSSVPLKPTVLPEYCTADLIPKKKSRKSSMPIKIEKEALELDEGKGSCSEDETSIMLNGRKHQEDNGDWREGLMGMERKRNEMRAIYFNEEREREDPGRPSERSPDRETTRGEKQGEGDGREDEVARQAETGVITCASFPFDNQLKENQSRGKRRADDVSLCRVGEEGRMDCERVHAIPGEDKRGEPEGADGERWLTNGGTFQHRESDTCPNNNNNGDDYGCDPGTGHFDSDSGLPHHCELCSKTFKNPYSVKMHYRNVHLKEMHMCTVIGCNAAFPSRRSRDRHSANINLHHKLLTKDKYELSGPFYAPSPISRDREAPVTGALDYCSEQRDRDLLPRDPAGQASVIFRGHNRMGLVFPMSKMADPPSEHTEVSPSEDMDRDEVGGAGGSGGRGGGVGGGGVDGEAVLDLSTTSTSSAATAAAQRGAPGGVLMRSSWDSDGAGSEEEGGEGLREDEEEGEGEEEDEGDTSALPMEFSDESCDGLGAVKPGTGDEEEEGEEEAGDRTPGEGGGGGGGGMGGPHQGGLLHTGGGGGGGVGSPITCHICHKVYSNKGTFRAHYKTVHLRLLHKCKVPGCDTSFSSVRSRNRHSQNPNLHRNMAVGSATPLLNQE